MSNKESKVFDKQDGIRCPGTSMNLSNVTYTEGPWQVPPASVFNTTHNCEHFANFLSGSIALLPWQTFFGSGDVSRAEHALALVTASFTIRPIVVLHLLSRDFSRRRRLKDISVSFTALAIGTVVTVFASSVKFQDSSMYWRKWELDRGFSLSDHSYSPNINIYSWIVSGIIDLFVLLVLVRAMILLWLRKWSQLDRGRSISSMFVNLMHSRILYLISLLLAVVLKYVPWVVLILVRLQLLTDAGGGDDFQKWTFGQVVAVLTWLPVCVEIV